MMLFSAYFNIPSKMNKNNRSSNIEILRILSMFFIVASHYAVWGLKVENKELYIPVKYNFLPLLGGVAICLFILASGYFMAKSKITISKISKVLFHTISYAAILSSIAYFFGPPHFDINLKNVIKSALGITGSYWFINTYIGLMLIVPFLNVLVHHLSHKQHTLCIASLFLLTSFIPTYFHIPTYCSQLCFFILLYMIAAFIRTLNLQRLSKWKLIALLSAISTATIAWIYSANIAFKLFESEYLYQTLLYFAVTKESLPVILISILIFLICIKSNIGSSRIINFLASCTLGVYLFHEHPLMRDFIWQKVLHTAEAPFCEHPIIHCIGSILGIYIAGTIVDIIWQQTVGRLYAPIEHYIIMPIYTRVKKWGNRLIQYITE